MEKLIQKWGSEAELLRNYVCRDARRLRKEGLSDDEIRMQAKKGLLQIKPQNKTAKLRKVLLPDEQDLQIINQQPKDPQVIDFFNLPTD